MLSRTCLVAAARLVAVESIDDLGEVASERAASVFDDVDGEHNNKARDSQCADGKNRHKHPVAFVLLDRHIAIADTSAEDA